MNPSQNMAADQAAGNFAVPVLWMEGVAEAEAKNTEHVAEDLWARATQMSRLLEDILHEPHGQPRWGLNE